MTKNVPSRSRGSNERCSHSITPAAAHCRIWAVASGATTLTDARSASSPWILPSATTPAPTIRQGRDSSFRKIGNIVFLYKREKPITRGTGDGLFRSFCSQCFRSEASLRQFVHTYNNRYKTDSALSEKRSSIPYMVGTQFHRVNVTDESKPLKVSILLIEILKFQDRQCATAGPLPTLGFLISNNKGSNTRNIPPKKRKTSL